MWHWDQGHLAFFQFEALRRISVAVRKHDFLTISRDLAEAETGLDFPAPKTHTLWRQYSRVLKLCLLVSKAEGRAQATSVAAAFSKPGAITCDDFFHFLVRSFTEPSPALNGWDPDAEFRFPLLFALKYLLTKRTMGCDPASIDELIGAYRVTGFAGGEGPDQFISAIDQGDAYEAQGRGAPTKTRRQARESLLVMAQISYLHVEGPGPTISVSLDKADAGDICCFSAFLARWPQFSLEPK